MAAARVPMTPDVQDERFVGEIAGVGTRSGTRVVIGRWTDAPLGPFADVMVEEPRGYRILLAPTREVAAYVSTVYEFDEVVVGDVRVERAPDRLAVHAPHFELDLRIGGRDLLGRVLHAVPASVCTSPRWAAMVDPFCRLVLRDVRTRTRTAGADEYYGATDRHRILGASATWRGVDLGPLGDVSPPVRFGGSSTPRRPSIVAVTTTVRRR